jgi:hypothetical protein
MISLIAIISFFAEGTGAEVQCYCNSPKHTGSQPADIYRTMQADIYEFMNNRKWTDHAYTYDEKIKCNILIRLDEQLSTDEFRGSIQVQLVRPVFGSSYETTVLNIKDNDFRARYVEFQALEFNETSNRDNLTNILAYYVYIILGFDYDTFSPEGGNALILKRRRRL